MFEFTPTASINEPEIHDLLRNDRRRAVIDKLSNRVGVVTLRELAEEIAAIETGESPPPRRARESVYNSLHQTHLPKLDERGVVEYDRDRKTVSLKDGARHVTLYMEVVTPYGLTWADYYRTLGVVGLCTVVAASVGVPFFSAVESVFWASLFLVVFAVSVAYQLWKRRWFYLRPLFS
jgi:hypothetical protein